MAVMDGAIANGALLTIAKDLNASPAFSIWIVNGYQLAIRIALLPIASLREMIGYPRVYLAGLLLFTLASFLCALAHTLPLLTVARILQGFGAAGDHERQHDLTACGDFGAVFSLLIYAESRYENQLSDPHSRKIPCIIPC